ncbi:MAG: Biotin transporter BioY [Hyphomicrobiaceae bacterium hypho_1]
MSTHTLSTTARLISLSEYSALFRPIALVVFGSLLLTLSAKIKIPLQPISITMQVFVVLALGFCLNTRLSVCSVIFYLTQGILGFPVFADAPEKGVGIAYVLQDTGGFLAGFVFAVVIVSWLTKRGYSHNIPSAMFTSLVGLFAIYTPGMFWLLIHYGSDIAIISIGLLPNIAFDLIKAALIALVVPTCLKKLSELN